jgi:hypothetical protein
MTDLGTLYIRNELLAMGFYGKMVDALLECEVVEDTNAAVELLIKHPTGWSHRYVSSVDFSDVCKICDEKNIEHASYWIAQER